MHSSGHRVLRGAGAAQAVAVLGGRPPYGWLMYMLACSRLHTLGLVLMLLRLVMGVLPLRSSNEGGACLAADV